VTERPSPPEQGLAEMPAEPVLSTEAEHDLQTLEEDRPVVGIVIATRASNDVMRSACEELRRHGISYEQRVLSPHFDGAMVADYAGAARSRGLKVLIAAESLAAALPSLLAAHTDLPVIGVPLRDECSVAGGLDALLSVVQTPPGAPVASVGLDAARNAALVAVRILQA
jgi:5-(carboxyamino)imidazole ribonucleotide mutase